MQIFHLPSSGGVRYKFFNLITLSQVCCLPFMYPHAVRLLLCCCITDMGIVASSLVGASTSTSVLARFNFTGMMAGSSPVCYSLLMRPIFFVALYSSFGKRIEDFFTFLSQICRGAYVCHNFIFFLATHYYYFFN